MENYTRGWLANIKGIYSLALLKHTYKREIEKYSVRALCRSNNFLNSLSLTRENKKKK